MENDYLERKEIGDYRITIERDDYAECPTKDWDMLGHFIWEFNDCPSKMRLSSDSDTEDLSCDPRSLEDALKDLVCKYVSQKNIIKYINSSECDDLFFEYSKSDKIWSLYSYDRRTDKRSEWPLLDLHPDEYHSFDFREEICDNLGEDDFKHLLYHYQKEIAFTEFSTCGYCQGDYADGIAYCDIERFRYLCDTDTKKWRERAVDAMNGESKILGKWMWGDVISFTLEKKMRFTKHYESEEKTDVDTFEWEVVDSCYGFYDDADELMQMVIDEHDLEPKSAA